MAKPPLNCLSKTCIAVAIAQCIVVPLHAATIVVDTVVDTSGLVGTCSLRDAINSANTNSSPLNSSCAAGSGSDIIDLSGLNGEITLGSALPTVISDITVQGSGQDSLTISGSNSHRIFATTGTAVLTINSLTLANGSAFSGGAVYARNASKLYINDCALSGHSANRGAAVGSYNYYGDSGKTSITINSSTLSGNTASFLGGAVNGYGGDDLNITDSTLSGNSSSHGGAINADGLIKLSISGSTLSANSTTNQGGALSVQNFDNAVISNSTLSGNSAGKGGAIFAFNSDNLTIINNTLSENSVSQRGGAVYASFSDNLSISNSLLSGNITSDSGAEIYSRSSTITTDSHNLFGDSSNSFTAAFTNFIPSATSIVTTSTVNGGAANPDAVALSSIINPLADNGGATLTHDLVVGSPAINQGDNTVCAADPIFNVDQLGNLRPMDGVCDIGSIESVGSVNPEPEEETFFVVPVTNGKAVIFSL